MGRILSLRQQLELAKARIDADQTYMREQKDKITELQISNRHLSQVANAFDRLLDGVCAGMKEGNFPRRPH